MFKHRPKNTSWNKVAGWYQKLTKEGHGHYYHEHVIIPKVLKLLNLKNPHILNTKYNILDLGCGNGLLAKNLPKSVKYTGIDLSENLIRSAKYENKNRSAMFIQGDITHPLNLTETYTHAVIMLALQNVRDPKSVFENVSKLLAPNSKFLVIINHPMFRIPRQTSWGFDESRKIQYRRVDKYMTPMEIPINMNPSDRNSEVTMSYHFPLSEYVKMLSETGFVIEKIEEYTSDKESFGTAKKMEDRARNEIPLFMAILAKKI